MFTDRLTKRQAISYLELQMELLKLNQEAMEYGLKFVSSILLDKTPYIDIYLDDVFVTATLSLEHLRAWFGGFKYGVGEITINIHDYLTDEEVEYISKAAEKIAKPLSPKKKK